MEAQHHQCNKPDALNRFLTSCVICPLIHQLFLAWWTGGDDFKVEDEAVEDEENY